MESIFDKTGVKDMREYLSICSKHRVFDLARMERSTLEIHAFNKGDKTLRRSTMEGQELLVKWYKSLENKRPDYSVYDASFYISDLWSCWTLYSRKYLLAMKTIRCPEAGKTIAQDVKKS